jgi:hypothetical protein
LVIETDSISMIGPTINLQSITSKIMVALAPFPEARYAVAAALHAGSGEQPASEQAALESCNESER